MSIKNSIANVRQRIGGGCDRTAYYSKKYDAVIKVSSAFSQGTSGSSFDRYEIQNDREQDLFYMMTEAEKKVFPIIDVVDSRKQGLVVLMKRAIVAKRYVESLRLDCNPNWGKLYDSFENLNHNCLTSVDYKVFKSFGITITSVKNVVRFAKKYGIVDLHSSNLGIIGKNLVIIDAGLDDRDS